MDKYILDENGEPRPVFDLIVWAQQFKDAMADVAKYRDPSGALVSTVFLGMDHNFGDGPPILWETMIFDDDRFPEYQERYTSKADALAGHERAVALVRTKS